MVENIELKNSCQANWLQIYGNKIAVYLGITILMVGVTSYWRHHRNYQDLLANKIFDIVLYAMSVNDNLTVKNNAMELLKYSNRTPYSRLAGLMLAKVFIMENNLIEAEKILNLVFHKQNTKDSIWHLANLRLIKVLLLQNKFSEAEKNINLGIAAKKFMVSYQELLGDLLVANNKLADANVQYQQAINNLPENTLAPWLQLKINEIYENNGSIKTQ